MDKKALCPPGVLSSLKAMTHLATTRHFLTQQMGRTCLVTTRRFPTYQKGQKPLVATKHFVPIEKDETYGHL
jgi:hypothetical protein